MRGRRIGCPGLCAASCGPGERRRLDELPTRQTAFSVTRGWTPPGALDADDPATAACSKICTPQLLGALGTHRSPRIEADAAVIDATAGRRAGRQAPPPQWKHAEQSAAVDAAAPLPWMCSGPTSKALGGSLSNPHVVRHDPGRSWTYRMG